MQTTRFLSIVLGMALVAPASNAGRSYDEASSIKKVKVTSSKLEGSEKALGYACTLQSARSKNFDGQACRLYAFRQSLKSNSAQNIFKVKNDVIKARAALESGKSLVDFKPVSKTPGFYARRARAHHQSCMVAFDLVDRVEESRLKGRAKERVKGVIKNEKLDLFNEACLCAQDTVAMSSAPGLRVEEKGRWQGLVTSRGCFLDRDKVFQEKNIEATEFRGEAQRFGKVGQVEDREKIKNYVTTQELTIERCKDKIGKGRKLKKADLVEKCVCNAVKRWHFPKLSKEENLKIPLELVEGKLNIGLEITPKGSVAQCGGFTGFMAPRKAK